MRAIDIKKPVGLISATGFESSLIASRIKNRRPIKTPCFSFIAGNLEGKKIVHVSSGMGIANAAMATAVLIEKFSPRFIILFGIGGAYPFSGLLPGDIAVAKREIYADSGLILKDGLHGFDAIGIPLAVRGKKKFFGEFSLDAKAARMAARLTGAKAGTFLTVAASTGTLKRSLELRNKFGAICENMEGAAVAQACYLYGVPLVEIRGISNMVEDRAPKKWLKDEAALNCQMAVLKLLAAF